MTMTTIATITSKNQLTIPKEVMERLNLDQIRKVLVSLRNGSLTIKPLVSKAEMLAGSLSFLAKRRQGDIKKIETVTRKKIAAQIAGEGV